MEKEEKEREGKGAEKREGKERDELETTINIWSLKRFAGITGILTKIPRPVTSRLHT